MIDKGAPLPPNPSMLPPMERRYRRWMAFAQARVQRALASARQAVLTDIDVTRDRRAADLAEAEAFASSAAELGAVVAKIAQVRAYLDVTGVAATAEARALLARLWDRMPPRPASTIAAVVTAELGAPPQALFAHWEEAPLAAASLGQVHAARDADGRLLAVKVQYPGVAEALTHDLASPALLRRLLGEELGSGVADEALAVLRTQLLGELDYRAEADWLTRFGSLFAADPSIVIPTVDTARSTGRVLTMERLMGPPLAALAERDQEAVQRTATALFRFAFGAPLRFGVFNADPHPGNYLLLDQGVGFVDFGSSAALSPELAEADRRLFLALIRRDGEMLRHAAHTEGLVASAQVFESATWREWERALAAPFMSRGPFTLTARHASTLIARTGELLRLRRLALPPSAILLWRQRLGALAVVGGLEPTLDFRRLLADLLDDGSNPLSLYDRWR